MDGIFRSAEYARLKLNPKVRGTASPRQPSLAALHYG